MPSSSSPFQGILVATDFSEGADAALDRGVWLGQKAQCGVTLVHVLTNLREAFTALPYSAKTEFLSGDIEAFERALRANSQQRLDKVVRRFSRRKTPIQTETLLGKPDVAVTWAVQKEGYDVVLVGTRGLTGMKKLLLGSTAGRLIRHCPASVWVVKAGSGWPLKRILVGVDFSEVSRRALDQAGWLAAQSGAGLDVLHVIEMNDSLAGLTLKRREAPQKSAAGLRIEQEASQRLNEWCQDLDIKASRLTTHVAWGTAWKVMADRSRRWHSDLIVLGIVGRTAVSGLLIGNTAERVLNHCDCSLFTVKPPGFVSPIQPPVWTLHPTGQ